MKKKLARNSQTAKSALGLYFKGDCQDYARQ